MNQARIIQAAHLARCILNTLCSRPISESNRPFLQDNLSCLFSFMEVIKEFIQNEPDSRLHHDCLQLYSSMELALQDPSPAKLQQLKRYIETDCDFYAPIRREPYRFKPLASGVLKQPTYKKILLMVGPGIGLGDEIQFIHFFVAMCSTMQIPYSEVNVHTFVPNLWQTMAPELPVSNLAGNPLNFFSEVEKATKTVAHKDVLVVFANFMLQEMFRCLMPYEQQFNGLELALASGQAWVQLRNHKKRYTHREVDPLTPNFCRALQKLFYYLTHSKLNISRTVSSPPERTTSPFRLLINPFTSKNSPLTPADWANMVKIIRGAIPTNRSLQCTIYPGLTPWCLEYAEQVAQICMSYSFDETSTTLLGQPPLFSLNPANAVSVVYQEIQQSDFLLNIDTYTAHMAATTSTPSLALCLNWNTEFWEPALHTFWVTICEGLSPAEQFLDVLIRLLCGNTEKLNLPGVFFEKSRQLHRLGDPLNYSPLHENWSKQRHHYFYRRAKATWHCLPPVLQLLLKTVDKEISWPSIHENIKSPAYHESHIALSQYAESVFFRLSNIAATPIHSKNADTCLA